MLAAAAAILVSCAPRPAPAPVLTPPPAAPPLAASLPVPPPAPPADWRDRPLAPGDWSYTGQSGIFEAGFSSPGGPLFGLRCEAGRQIVFFVFGVPAGPMTIVTSFGERVLPGSGNEHQTIARLAAADPLFDEIVFSRGRFLVQVAGGSALVLPTWPEPARVIEECRR